MNKLQTNYNGKMPFELDDLRWMDDAYREAFYALLSAFGIAPEDSFKLSGCVVTVNGNVYTTTAGYISLNGEILKVNAHSITKSLLHSVYWVLDVAYDIAGNEIFEDGNSHDTYEVRTAKLATGITQLPINVMMYNADYLSDKIASIIPLEENWHYIGGANEPVFENLWTNSPQERPLRFKKDINNYVHIEGVAIDGTMGFGIFTLPVGYRPSVSLDFIVKSSDSSGFVVGVVRIFNTGLISIGGNPIGQDGVAFNGLIFKAD